MNAAATGDAYVNPLVKKATTRADRNGCRTFGRIEAIMLKFINPTSHHALLDEGRNAVERIGTMTYVRGRIVETLTVVEVAAPQETAVDPAQALRVLCKSAWSSMSQPSDARAADTLG